MATPLSEGGKWSVDIDGLGAFDVSEKYLELVEDTVPTHPMDRAQILEDAKSAVLKDRNLEYGDPEDNFRQIADMWNTYINKDKVTARVKIEPHDVAAMLIIVKLSRLMTSPHQKDHWVDIAGYAACGAQAYERNQGAI